MDGIANTMEVCFDETLLTQSALLSVETDWLWYLNPVMTTIRILLMGAVISAR